MPILPPTSSLPPLLHLRSQSSSAIQDALDNLRSLYCSKKTSAQILPPQMTVPARSVQHLIHDSSVPDSGYASGDEDCEFDGSSQHDDSPLDEDLEVFRADTFERDYAVRWLTGLVARSHVWFSTDDEEELERRQELVDEASSLLSTFVFSGQDEEESAVTRSFTFDTPSSLEPVRVELNDAPLDKEDHTSVGLQSWASSILLAKRMCLSPASFSLHPPPSSSLRVLELGAGTGLLSIVAAKLLAKQPHTIVATDYHTDVLDNLKKNVATNFANPESTIHVCTLDWQSPRYMAPLDGRFDVVLAADVIYHTEHARWIKGCVEALLTLPTSANDGGIFWLVIPLRTIGRHEGMDASVDIVFPNASNMAPRAENGEWRLAVMHREEAPRLEKGVGRADEGGYKLFKIAWI